MSNPARGPRAPHGAPSGNRGGSVRAARLRAEQGEPLERRARPQPSRPPPNNMSTQWPLPEGEPVSAPPRARGPPPQRPPRPHYVPSILDPTKQSDRLAPGQDQASPGDGELLSPYFGTRDSNRVTGNSVNSSASLGSIPDFPVPNAPRKPPALGPPPSARRGPSSYYSQTSYVSPIVEEAESHRSHNSFASSNVIPANAGEFYFDDDDDDDDDDAAAAASDDDEDLGSPTERGDSDDGRSRPSDDGDQSGLVRQASMGKRGKPSLTTIKSMDSMDKLRERDKNGQGAGAALPAVAATPVGPAVSKQSSRDELRGGTGLIPPSPSSSSDESKESGKSPLSKEMLDDDDLDSPIDPRVEEILGGLERGGMSDFGKETRETPKLSDRAGQRRPPKLNVDALHEAESRGSLTSLPDLIRRATKLASNLDRGKTASRLGFDVWELGGSNGDEKRAALAAAARKSDNVTLAEMLTSFPRPATASPAHSSPRSPYGTRWPTGLAHQQHHDGQAPPKKRGRRCCGFPLWAFITLIITILLLIAAAVAVPLKLVVFKDNDDSNASQQKSVSGCEASLPCSNGGTSMLDPTGSCACICANGYTGARCTQAPESACTTTTMGGSDNATIGSAVPELINNSQNSFQIPLNGTQLLALFSKANMSCSAENALVTFSGLSKKAKRGLDWHAQIELFLDSGEEEDNVAKPAPAPVPMSNANGPETHCDHAARPFVTSHPRLQRRQFSSDAAKTNLGIVYDANGGSSMYSATSTVTSTPTSTTISTSTSTSGISAKRLAFCQTGVLYIYQASSSLDHAVAAQENLQTYFTEYVAGGQAAMSATAVSLGNGWTIDLAGWTVKDGRGVSVGNTRVNAVSASG